MTINNLEKYYGAVILRLLSSLGKEVPGSNFSIRDGESKSSFIIHGNKPSSLGKGNRASIGLFIKISNKRLSPWGYSFDKVHQDEIANLYQKFGEVFIAFVASNDGIACINFKSLKSFLDHDHAQQEWVRVSRKRNENYRIKGNDGALEKPLPRNSFPNNIVQHFKTLIG
jgi:hypothetical protein